MNTYKVLLLSARGEVVNESIVKAFSPEGALRSMTPEDLNRGRAKMGSVVLRASVYWVSEGVTTMARFYGTRVSD